MTASGHAAEIQSLASEFPRTPSMAAVQGAGVGAGNWMVSGAASGPGGVGTGGHSTSAGAANGMGSMAGVSGTGMSGAGGHPSNTLGKRSASSRYFGNQQIFFGKGEIRHDSYFPYSHLIADYRASSSSVPPPPRPPPTRSSRTTPKSGGSSWRSSHQRSRGWSCTRTRWRPGTGSCRCCRTDSLGVERPLRRRGT